MRRQTSVGVVGAVLGAALGLGPLGCGATAHSAVECDGGACESSGASSTSSRSGSSSTSGSGSSSTSSSHASSSAGYIPCESPSPIVVNGVNTGYVQCSGNVSHRASVVSCPSALPRAGGGVCPIGQDHDAGFEGTCASDSDCTAHPLGTCDVPTGGGVAVGCICSYGCVHDSDCGNGAICECGDPVGSCVPATCTSDEACPTGSLCASNAGGAGSCGIPSQFSCEATADQCLSTNECQGSTGGPACVAETSPDGGLLPRTCTSIACAGGRPFLVDAVARVAGVVSRSDWRCGASIAAPALDDASRAVVAAHWIAVGQMEHASIAAFARFALELLALGAPAHLVMASSTAMADETEHARLAFDLATQYGGAEVGPGPLDITGALTIPDEKTVFATLLREGCIGETLAAVEATEAHAQATAPAVKAALARIAADETRHAELAFRAARWLLERGDHSFREWAEAEVARAIAERMAAPVRADAAGVPGHGVPDARLLDGLGRQALMTLVAPCCAALSKAVRGATEASRQASFIGCSA